MRVLKWIIDRCRGRAYAVEKTLGWMPRRQDIDLERLDHLAADLDAMQQSIRKPSKGVAGQEELFLKLAGDLPKEMIFQRELLSAGCNRRGLLKRSVTTMKTVTLNERFELNSRIALANRKDFDAAGLKVISLVGPAGSGKTSAIEALLTRLDPKLRVAVMVGNLAADRQVSRITRHGYQAVPLITDNLTAVHVRETLYQLDCRILTSWSSKLTATR